MGHEMEHLRGITERIPLHSPVPSPFAPERGRALAGRRGLSSWSCEGLIGPRGSFDIDRQNRYVVREAQSAGTKKGP